MTNVKYPMNLQLFAEDDPQDPPADPQPPKTFTQEELDAIVRDRLARDRKGREDYDDLKTKLAALEQAEEERRRAELSATERLEAEKDAALKAAEAAKAERDKALTAANQRLIKAEFRALARELNVRADAIDDAYVLADLTSVSVDESGNPIGVEDAVKALLTHKPYLVDVPKKPQPIGDGKHNTGEDERRTLEQQLADARKAKDFAKVIELSNKLKK